MTKPNENPFSDESEWIRREIRKESDRVISHTIAGLVIALALLFLMSEIAAIIRHNELREAINTQCGQEAK